MSRTIAAMPAYNEERSIAKMVLGASKYVDTVVVVDDGSSDSTAEIAEALGAYVVRHKKNGGYGAALRTCFETARALEADKMVIIDSDGQHDPSEIPKLLDPLNNGTDLVIGSRFCNGNGKNVPAYRKVGMKVLDIATAAAGGASVSDSQSGFRGYGLKAIESIYIKESDMAAGSEILLQAKDNDLRIKEVDIHCRYDVDRASTQNPVSHGIKTLLKILQDMELRRPLFYFTLPGVVMASVGILVGLHFLSDFHSGGSMAYGPTLLMILLTLVGSFMTLTGVILHAISKIMYECRMDFENLARAKSHEHRHSAWNPTRDN